MSASADVHHEVFGGNLRQTLGTLLRNGAIRPLLRLATITTWTGGALLALAVGRWLASPWPGRQLWYRHRVTRRWARGTAWLLNMRVTVRGTPPVPPFFLVSNHLSYCDIVLLLGELPGVFVAKQEVDAWPAVGYMTRLAGTIFVDRTRPRDTKRVLEVIAERVSGGDGVIVFPEGTSSGGESVYPMRAALFEWAAASRTPVHIATIQYTTPPGMPSARDVVCWWGEMHFVPHLVQLLQMPGFDATLQFADAPITGNDRGRLAAEARATMVSMLFPHQVQGV